MHELSIASHLVEIATQHIQDLGSVRVERIRLKIGALSCVHPDSLLFSFGLVTAETTLAGAELHIESLPILIYCKSCDAVRELPGVQSFRCPTCQTLSADIRQGRELDIDSIEYVEMEPSKPAALIATEASS